MIWAPRLNTLSMLFSSSAADFSALVISFWLLPAISRRSSLTSSGRIPLYLNTERASTKVFLNRPRSSPILLFSSSFPNPEEILSAPACIVLATGATIGTPPIADIVLPPTAEAPLIIYGPTIPNPIPSPAAFSLFLSLVSEASLPLKPSKLCCFNTSGALSKKFATPV